jgi:hypothetical protein
MGQGRNANREGARSNELYVLQALNRIENAIAGSGTAVKVPLLERISGAATSSVASGKSSVSFFNAGPTDATITGAVLKPGESITFDAGNGAVLSSILYETIATGDLVITTIT